MYVELQTTCLTCDQNKQSAVELTVPDPNVQTDLSTETLATFEMMLGRNA